MARPVLWPVMDAFEARLGIAEFEELWTEVEYHAGRARVADVERAIARVDELRGLARRHRADRLAGLPRPARRATATLGH
jgi:hypothetical protein